MSSSGALLALLAATAAAVDDYDVVVYGSSPAGVAAAVVAGRGGARVGLFEPLAMIGGMGAAGNLALNDGNSFAEKTGLALEFVTRAATYYGLPAGSEVAHPESFASDRVGTKVGSRRRRGYDAEGL